MHTIENMHTIEEFIQRNAVLYPDRIAFACDGDSITYSSLWHDVQMLGKRIANDVKQPAVIMRASQSIGFITEYFAIHLAGKVAVPLEQDIPDSDFSEIYERIAGLEVPEGVADILFTTGTTGKRKGTMLTHSAILADADNLIESQGFSHDLNFIIAGPLNHIGSLSKIWPCMMLGCTVTILEGIKDMNLFFDVIRQSDDKVATFLVPASIRMLLQLGSNELNDINSKIDFIETGAAPISQSDMEALCSLLPDTRLYNTYASTETGIICTHDYNAGYCVAGCLGKVMKNSDLAIDADGLISCGGATIMAGYAGDEAATADVLRDNRVFTCDMGRLDEEGRLHLTGRRGDIINVGGYKINPVDVENAAKSFPGIDDCICIPAKHPVLGTAMRLLYVSGNVIDRKELGRYLMSRLEKHKVPQFLTQTESINRTYNGKLDRKSYLMQD